MTLVKLKKKKKKVIGAKFKSNSVITFSVVSTWLLVRITLDLDQHVSDIKYSNHHVHLLAFSGAFKHIPQSCSSNGNFSGVTRAQLRLVMTPEDCGIALKTGNC